MSQDDDRAAKQDISEVLVRYATGIDRRDWIDRLQPLGMLQARW